MPTIFSWPLVPEVAPSPTPEAPTTITTEQPALRTDRRGLRMPFRRDAARDFATTTGDDLLTNRIAQIIGVFGELPWRHEMNSQLDRLRNTNNSIMLAEFAAMYCRDALTRYEPSVALVSVQAKRTDRTIDLALTCQRVADRGTGRTFEVQTSISRGT